MNRGFIHTHPRNLRFNNSGFGIRDDSSFRTNARCRRPALREAAGRVTLLVRARDFRDIRAMQAAEKMDLVAVDDDLAGEVAWGASRVKVPLAAIYEGV